jgi:hypothetical protein
MNQKIRDYVATQKEPNFFSNNGDEELAIVHTEIQRGIETATDVMTFEIDLDVMLRAQAFLATIGRSKKPVYSTCTGSSNARKKL